jgi:hypothetical protein
MQLRCPIQKVVEVRQRARRIQYINCSLPVNGSQSQANNAAWSIAKILRRLSRYRQDFNMLLTLQAGQLLDVWPGLTLNSPTFLPTWRIYVLCTDLCALYISMCFVRISEKRAILCPQGTNWLDFAIQKQCVHCAVGNGSSKTIQVNLGPKGLKSSKEIENKRCSSSSTANTYLIY